MARRAAQETIPVGPFKAFLEHHQRRLESENPQEGTSGIGRLSEWIGADGSGLKRAYLDRPDDWPGELDRIEDLLNGVGVMLWEVYDFDMLPEPAEGPDFAVDSRGRSLTKRRGVPPKLTDEQIEAAWRLHMHGGLSIRELGKRGYDKWGFKSPESAANRLSEGFKRLALPTRDRIEATVKVSTIHGRARRNMQGDPDHLAYRRELKRANGEVRDVRCEGIRASYPRKGERCQHFALKDSQFCRMHDPRYREETQANAREARSKRRVSARDGLIGVDARHEAGSPPDSPGSQDHPPHPPVESPASGTQDGPSSVQAA